MKTKYVVIPGTRFSITPTSYKESKTNAARYAVTPRVEINLGNKVDPTPWKYDVKSDQLFHGRIYDKPRTGLSFYIGAVGTGQGDITQRVTWDRAGLYKRALDRLNRKAHERSDWSEDIFQLPQTRKLGNLVGTARDMVANAIMSGRDKDLKRGSRKGSLGRVFNGAKSGNRSGGHSEGSGRSDIGKSIAEASSLAATMQLQTSYALKPLIGNIFDTANAILQVATDQGVKIRGGATDVIEVDRNVSNNNIYCSKNEVKHVERGKQGCRIEVFIDGRKGFNPLDWITLNPLLLGWNLIPYSFVADWFYDVGGYLESVEDAFRNNGSFRSGHIQYLYANYITEEVLGASSNPWTGVDFARARQRVISFEREVLHAWPLPRLPRLNVDLGSGQLLSAAALLRNLLK